MNFKLSLLALALFACHTSYPYKPLKPRAVARAERDRAERALMDRLSTTDLATAILDAQALLLDHAQLMQKHALSKPDMLGTDTALINHLGGLLLAAQRNHIDAFVRSPRSGNRLGDLFPDIFRDRPRVPVQELLDQARRLLANRSVQQ